MKKSLFTKIDCVRIPVPNLDNGLEFYSKKLGHQLLWKTELSAGLILEDDKSEIVLYTKGNDLEIDFKVDNVEMAVKEFTKIGGRVVEPIFDITIGKCVIVEDPWNNKYVLLDSSKGLLKTDSNKNVIGLNR